MADFRVSPLNTPRTPGTADASASASQVPNRLQTVPRLPLLQSKDRTDSGSRRTDSRSNGTKASAGGGGAGRSGVGGALSPKRGRAKALAAHKALQVSAAAERDRAAARRSSLDPTSAVGDASSANDESEPYQAPNGNYITPRQKMTAAFDALYASLSLLRAVSWRTHEQSERWQNKFQSARAKLRALRHFQEVRKSAVLSRAESEQRRQRIRTGGFHRLKVLQQSAPPGVREEREAKQYARPHSRAKSPSRPATVEAVAPIAMSDLNRAVAQAHKQTVALRMEEGNQQQMAAAGSSPPLQPRRSMPDMQQAEVVPLVRTKFSDSKKALRFQ